MIPDEAVEAALRAWAVRGGLSPKGIVRNILEATAPHLMAQGWDEGYEGGKSDAFAQDKGFTGYHANPYRKPTDA